MSYLENSGSPFGNKAIISVWVKTQSKGPESKWDEELLPPHLESELKEGEVAFVGGSYFRPQTGVSLADLSAPPVLFVYPPGPPPFSGVGEYFSFKNGIAPFITWGDSKQPYNHCEWKKKVLRTDYWLFGKGAKLQQLVCQYPVGTSTIAPPQQGGGAAPAPAAPAAPAPTAAPASGPSIDTRASSGTGPIQGRPSAPAITRPPTPGIPLPTKTKPAGPIQGLVPPSCIGVSGDGNLVIILQTNSRATYTGFAWAQSKAQAVHVQTPLIPRGIGGGVAGYVDFGNFLGLPGGGQWRGNAFWYDDVSAIECTQHPETFIMHVGKIINDDKWHHILFSYDLGGAGGGGGAAPPPTGGGGTPSAGTRASSGPALDPGPVGGSIPMPPGAGGAAVIVETDGDDAPKPFPGTWGQYPGPNGEFALATADWRPQEDVGLGKYPLNKCKISSACQAWLYVDGVKFGGINLHHKGAWTVAKAFGYDLSTLESNDLIVPVNALAALSGDPRVSLTTNQTSWERDYRTQLGKFSGPAALIEVTDEPRRYTYPSPKYELSSPTIAHGGFAIPAGTLWDVDPQKSLEWNKDIKIAELQIWTDQSIDVGSCLADFLDHGNPVPPKAAEQRLGKPNVRFRFASNWKKGINTGKNASRTTGDGAKPQTVAKPEAMMTPTGKISRYYPDPELGK